MRRFIITLVAVLSLAVVPAGIFSGNVLAACPKADSPNSDTSAKGQVLTGVGQTGSDCSDTQVTSTLAAIVTILSYVVGIIAVIVVINGGFKYITSGGEASKVANAKSTLVYALVGVAIAALAQFLVHFVLNGAANPSCDVPGHTNISATDPACKP